MTDPTAAHSGAPVLPSTFATPGGAVSAARASTSPSRGVPSQRPRSRRAVVAPPLGSIALAPPRTAPGTVSCASCESTALTHLRMTLTDGSPVVFVSCHDCEHKAWFAIDGTGVSISFESVLDSATKIR